MREIRKWVSRVEHVITKTVSAILHVLCLFIPLSKVFSKFLQKHLPLLFTRFTFLHFSMEDADPHPRAAAIAVASRGEHIRLPVTGDARASAGCHCSRSGAGYCGLPGNILIAAPEEDGIRVSSEVSDEVSGEKEIERRVLTEDAESRSGDEGTCSTFSDQRKNEQTLLNAVVGSRSRSSAADGGASLKIEPKEFIGETGSRSKDFAVDGGGGSCIWKMIAADGGGDGGDEEEEEEDGTYCSKHPYKRNPGGICAFCLQEKLGSLLSSSSKFNASFPVSVAPYTSPPSISTVGSRSNTSSSNGGSSLDASERKTRMTSILARKKGSHSLQRSRSSAVSTQRFLRRGSFWSFFHISRHSQAIKDESNHPPTAAPLPEREVCRSRSVGCGSRRFSGDIFERISTGFGDCALRRVESESDGGRRAAEEAAAVGERVRCSGRIFTSLSSSSTSLPSIWITPPYTADDRKRTAKSAAHGGGGRGWVWALASPMRVLSRSRTAGSTGKKDKPDLTAVPSLLRASS